eukprot:scaffold4357_cov113-Isochrysis_galbana.AAC.23
MQGRNNDKPRCLRQGGVFGCQRFRHVGRHHGWVRACPKFRPVFGPGRLRCTRTAGAARSRGAACGCWSGNSILRSPILNMPQPLQI